MVQLKLDTTVADVVTKDIRTAKVFRKYGIDFCCGGHKPINEVCKAKNVDYDTLIADLTQVERDPKSGSVDADKWNLDFLVDYIVNIHHKYVRETLPSLEMWSAKVARVHGDHNPETVRIAELVNEISAELTAHMHKEEKILFPSIVRIVKALRGEDTASFLQIEHPIEVMEHEHESVGNMYKEIESLSSQFTPPAHACNTFRALYNLLKEFEDDLFLHIHLENNILFPKALKLRDQLITK